MTDSDEELIELMGNHKRPRPHHYTFAHGVLRAMTLQEPERMGESLRGERGEAFLHGLWHHVGQSLNESERLRSVGLSLDSFGVAGNAALHVVRLPPPVTTTEAHMVAILLQPRPFRFPAQDQERLQPRYFTLERGLSETVDRTVLGEWTHSGDGVEHLNYGVGPVAREADFAATVCQLARLPRSFQPLP